MTAQQNTGMNGTESTEPGDPEDELTDEPRPKDRPLSEVFRGTARWHVAATTPLVPAWKLPTPGYTSFAKAAISSDVLRVNAAVDRMNKMLKPPIRADLLRIYQSPALGIAEKINEAIRAQLTPTFERLNTLVQNLFPPNWGDARPRDWDEFRVILAHEGIPMLWVPGPDIVAAIFAAESPAERRRVISRRWKGIVSDCETVLEGVTHRRLADERSFALDCVRALREGHPNAAQALAANLLDSVMQRFISKNFRRELTNNEFKTNGVTFDFDDYSFRLALTFAPVWCAHARYKPWKGDPIPSEYGRHASVHGVSRRQYKRINAVIALMLVTSVIKFFDVELKRRDARS